MGRWAVFVSVALFAAMLFAATLFAGCTRKPDRSQGVTELFDVQADADTPAGLSGQALTDRVVEVLGMRLDPENRGLLQVRAVAPSRVEVWIYRPKGAAVGGVGNDLDEIKRMVMAKGRLEFRIAVNPAEIPPDERNVVDQGLKDDGPHGSVMVGGLKARWFAIDPNGRSNFDPIAFVMRDRAGEPYLLCYDDRTRALTHTGHSWTLTVGNPYSDPQSGQLDLPFHLDAVGASLMGDLTSVNLHRNMTILLDDQAMTAPTIQARITDSGVVTFGEGRDPAAIRREAQQLRQILDVQVLPARLEPVAPAAPAAQSH